MTSTIFQKMKPYLQSSSSIELSYADALGTKTLTGVVLEIEDDGVLVESKGAITYVRTESLLTCHIISSNSHSNGDGRLDPKSPIAENLRTSDEQKRENEKADTEASLESAFVMFSGPIMAPVFEPSFRIPGLNRDDQSDLVRWTNRYIYAQKIHEPARSRDDIPAIARLAESLRSSAMFTLAGVLALKIGDKVRARELLPKAVALRSADASQIMGYLYAEDGKYEEACSSFLRYLYLCEALEERDNDLLISFGRSLNHLDNREIQGLALAVSKSTLPSTKRLAELLVAFSLVKTNIAGAMSVFRGDLTKGLPTTCDSPVFMEYPDLEDAPITPPKKEVVKPANRRGKIIANYLDRKFGFVLDDSTAETFYFGYSDVSPSALRQSIERGKSGHQVEFISGQRSKRDFDKYEAASIVGWIDSTLEHEPATRLDRAPRQVRLAALPKGEGAYVRAKRADQLDDLSQAEAYFREEIASQGPNRLSAVKDLASLLSRIGRGEEAISLLEETRSQFEFVRPVDNLLANFNFKSGHFDKAAEIFQRLQNGADRGARVSLIRQEAFCEFASGRYDQALALLEKLHQREPLDMQTSNLIERVKQARETGLRGALSAPEDEVLDIETISSGLSPFAKTLLDTCDFRGVDERSRARGFYDEKDFSAVEEQLNRVRGRRPRERADLSLTLAAIAFKAPEVAGDRTVHEFLRRYFTFMGEAAIYDNLHRDVARCHLTEAICYAIMNDIEAPLGLLVATYSGKDLSASEFGSQIRIVNILARFHGDEKSWERLAVDFPYYSSFSVGATRKLDGDIRKDRVLRNFLVPAVQLDKLRGSEAARIRKERTQLLALQSSLSSAGMLQDNVEILGSLARATRFELDRQRLLTLGSLLGEATLFWQDQDYVEKESKYARLTSGLSSFTKEIVDSPTKLSAEVLQPLARRLQEQMLHLFEEFQRNAAPELELSNVLGDDYSLLGEDGSLPVTLQLTSRAGSAPVEGIEVVISDEGGLELASPAFSPEVLRGGQSREVRVVLKPSSSQIDDGAFTMLAAIKYRTRKGDVGETGRRAIPVRLGSSNEFVPIVNPYHAYSGGTPVERPEMFFGRAQLLDRIESEVTEGPLGQCFVLYGQKRSGKTSILRQLERRVNKRAIAVPVTVGIMDTKEAEAEFVQMCIDKLFERLKSHYEIDCSCPVSSSEVTSGPIRAFRIAVTVAQKELVGRGYSPRVVLLIDEFSCIYEYIKEGIMTNAFMRHWKALLQMEAFSAVVVGQDSMPKFKQAFSNEFGVTHDERITYLARTEAIELAEAQIMLDGKTRYRGKALDRLLDLTAGSPFYLQIMCDRLVRHLNREKAVFVTEADIDIVARELVSGDDALPVEKFDPLITAAGESVAEASRETYLGLLNGIAQHSRQTGFASAEDVKPFEQSGRLLKDLAEREVIVRDSAGRVAIKVQLFSEWLRDNYMIG